MLLHEITDRHPLALPGYIAVAKGSLWQKDINNCWVFDTIEEAQRVALTEPARKILDKSSGAYLVPIKTLNDVPLLLQVSDAGYRAMKDFNNFKFYVLAFSVSEKSCKAAAEKAIDRLNLGISYWCYKTWNSDPAYFYEDEE